MYRVLVTGGNGLVGSAIKAAVKDSSTMQFYFPTRQDVDLRDAAQTLRYFQEIQPTHVIHCAAKVGGLFLNMSKPVEMLEENLLINSNVLRAAHETDVKRLVACLSTCIFPAIPPSYPLKEDMLHDGAPHESNFAYAHAKRLLEVQCEAYRKQHRRDFVCVTPTNVYGPHDNFNLANAHVIPALIHKLFMCDRTKSDLMLKGTGRPLRSFVYSGDLAKILLWRTFLEYDDDMSPHNMIISADEPAVTIAALVEKLATLMDFRGKIYFQGDHGSDGQYQKPCCNWLFKQWNPNFKFTSLEDGLKETIAWFKTAMEVDALVRL